MKKSAAAFYLFVCLVTSVSLMAEPGDLEKNWTLEECLAHGLATHPLLRAANSNVEVEKARIKQIGAAFDPRVEMRANWRRQRTESARTRIVADPMTDSTSESVSISKTIYDSGQNRMQRKAAEENLKATREKLQETRINIAADVKAAYFKAQQARAMLQVRLETLEGYEKHLEKVQGFVEVGTRPPYDITRAQVDVSNARVELISARSQLKVSLAGLARVMGLEDSINVAEYEDKELPEAADFSKKRFVEEALDRPDLKSAAFQVDSARFRISEARLNLKPTVSASGEYSWSGTATPLDRQWGMGISLSWPVFDGALTSSRIEIARRQLDTSSAGYENLKLSVNAEVENSVTRVADAIERFQATEYVVQQASESMHLAEGRYDAGLGSPIEIADARVELARARGNHVSAYFESLIALTELDRIIGRLPREIADTVAVAAFEKLENKQ